MSSKRVAIRGSQEPRVHLSPKAQWSEADDASFLAEAYGLTPDPWQHLVLSDWLARDRSDKWSAGRCGLAVPRQNGKNGCIEIRELYGMVALGEKFLHTAHEVKTARKAFKRLQHFFGESADDPACRYPDLNALVKEVRATNGQEAIVLKDVLDEDGNFIRSGGSVEFVARSRGSGRGYTVDVLILDEAQELTDEQLEALQSTISSAPSGNPQTILTGTPPGPNSPGEVFKRVRTAGLKGKNKRLSWIEWSIEAEANVNILDPKVWAANNPSLGIRLQKSVIVDELPPDGLSETGFMRERLGKWDTDTGAVESAVKVKAWQDLEIDDSDVPSGQAARFALSMSGERILSIAAVVDGEKPYVDLPECSRVDDPDAVVDWLVERCRRKTVVMIDTRDPAAQFVPALRARKVKVNVTTQTDAARASMAFKAAIDNGLLSHCGQPPIEDAIKVAVKREIGRGRQWEFDPATPAADITPLRAIVLAHYGLSFNKPKSGQGRRAVSL